MDQARITLPAADAPSAGHTVLAVPVPALDALVRERTAWYDASFVSADPGFVHAHITVLGPWVQHPSAVDLGTVAEIVSRVEPREVRLDEVTVFPNGLIHVRPEPDTVFRRLTSALVEAFPEHPPYGGAFPDPVPHLTLDHVAGGVSVAEVAERVSGVLPTTFAADRLDLQRWANDDCRLLHSWPLGTR